MKKLSKKLNITTETIEAYYCSTCGCLCGNDQVVNSGYNSSYWHANAGY